MSNKKITNKQLSEFKRIIRSGGAKLDNKYLFDAIDEFKTWAKKSNIMPFVDDTINKAIELETLKLSVSFCRVLLPRIIEEYPGSYKHAYINTVCILTHLCPKARKEIIIKTSIECVLYVIWTLGKYTVPNASGLFLDNVDHTFKHIFDDAFKCIDLNAD